MILGHSGSGYPLGKFLADSILYLSIKLKILLIKVPNKIINDGIQDNNKLLG